MHFLPENYYPILEKCFNTGKVYPLLLKFYFEGFELSYVHKFNAFSLALHSFSHSLIFVELTSFSLEVLSVVILHVVSQQTLSFSDPSLFVTN